MKNLIHNQILRHVFGMDVGRGARISWHARLDMNNPGGVHIGEKTFVGRDAAIVTRDPSDRRDLDVHIGRRCFIGMGSMILPGLTIGDDSIVAPGAVVTKDVPAASYVSGHPAKIREPILPEPTSGL